MIEKILPALLACTAMVSFGACGPRPNEETATAEKQPEQTFVVQGLLRRIDFAEQAIHVEHEEIPNYMPAMTMPFDVKAMSEVEPLKVGDAIEFRMIVTESDSWIEGVKKIAPSEIQLPKKEPRPSAPGDDVERLKAGDRLPDFQLVDSKGRQIDRETFAGRPLLLTFIFTRCPIPNYCPLMSENLRAVRDLLKEGSGAGPVQYLSVSFDPEFDTPAVLAQYAARYTDDQDEWRFATGTEEEIRRLTQAFSLRVQADSGTIDHSLATALIRPDGVIQEIWRGNAWKPGEVVDALGSQ